MVGKFDSYINIYTNTYISVWYKTDQRRHGATSIGSTDTTAGSCERLSGGVRLQGKAVVAGRRIRSISQILRNRRQKFQTAILGN